MGIKFEVLQKFTEGSETFDVGSFIEIPADEVNLWEEMISKSVVKKVEVKAKKKTIAKAVVEKDEEEVVSKKVDFPAVHIAPEVDGKGGFETLGHFLCDVRNHQLNNKMSKTLDMYMRSKAATGMNETVLSDGSALVPVEHSNTILENIYESDDIISRCFNLPLSSASVDIPYVNETSRVSTVSGGVGAYWQAEAAEYSVSKAGLGQLTIKPNDLVCAIPLTDNLLEDSPVTVDAFVKPLMARALSAKINYALINGTGVGQPLGIVNSPALISVTRADTSDVDVTEIASLYARLMPSSKKKAVWLVSNSAHAKICVAYHSLGASNQAAFYPPGMFSNAPYGSLMGLPMLISEGCAAFGSDNDIILADLSNYVLGTRGGLKMSESIHVRFVAGETVLKVKTRIDGRPWMQSAVTPMNSGATESAFVAFT